jgi:hypothetical protein
MSFVWNYADTYGSLIPVCAILILKDKVAREIYILLVYFIVSILIFGYSNYLADKGINNLFLYHLFSIIELIFLLSYFKKVIVNKTIQVAIKWSIFLFLLFSIINILFLENIQTLNSNTLAIEFFLIILLCLAYYNQLVNSNEVLLILKTPSFWIISSFLLYFSSCILMFILYKYAAKRYHSFVFDFWKVQEVMYLIKNLLITYGVLCFRKKKSISP